MCLQGRSAGAVGGGGVGCGWRRAQAAAHPFQGLPLPRSAPQAPAVRCMSCRRSKQEGQASPGGQTRVHRAQLDLRLAQDRAGGCQLRGAGPVATHLAGRCGRRASRRHVAVLQGQVRPFGAADGAPSAPQGRHHRRPPPPTAARGPTLLARLLLCPPPGRWMSAASWS